MDVSVSYWRQWKGNGHLTNSHNFSSKDNVDVGPRPKDLRLGKEGKNKKLKKRMDWWKEKKLKISIIHGEICNSSIKL